MKPLTTAVRKEDQRLLTGHGEFVDDFVPTEHLVGFVLRSPYPHAISRQIDTQAALQSPGVRLVLTHRDLEADHIGPLPCVSCFPEANDELISKPVRTVLAAERVRHVGEPVAFVVADTLAKAAHGAELINIEYEQLPSNSNVEEAMTRATEIWRSAKRNI